MRASLVHWGLVPAWSLLAIGATGAATTVLASDGTWFGQQTVARELSSLVFDSLRRRLILLGGFSDNEPCNDVWAMPLAEPGAWTRLDALDSGLPRLSVSAMYDVASDRIVAVSALDTSWIAATLPLSGAFTWTPLNGEAPRPPPRLHPLTCLDTPRHRLILAGGSTPDRASRADVWALSLDSTAAWQELTPPVAGPRHLGGTLVYDSVRDRLVFVVPDAQANGGWAVWTLAAGGGAWAPLPVSGTGPYNSGPAVFDSARSRALFIRTSPPSSFGSAQSFSLILDDAAAAWSPLSDVDSSPPENPGVCIDRESERAFVFGGGSFNGIAYRSSGTLWELDLSTDAWSTAADGNAAPFLRGQMFFDGPRDRLLLVGIDLLYGPPAPFAIWEMPYGSGRWTALPNSTHAALGTNVVLKSLYDPASDRLLVMADGTPTLLAYSLESGVGWQPIALGSATPPWALVYDLPRHRIMGISSSGEVEALAPAAGATWTPLPVTGTPPVTSGWSYIVYDPLRDVLQFGVRPWIYPYGYVSGLWSLSLGDTLHWVEEAAVGSGYYATGESMVLDPARARLLSFGGSLGEYVRSGSCYALDLVSRAPLATLHPSGSQSPAERAGATFAYDHLRDALVVHGGGNYTASFGGTWSLVFGPGDPPRATSAAAVAWSTGGSTAITFQIHNPYPFAQDVEYELRSTRAWPGFPLTGRVRVAAATQVPLVLDVPVPDTVVAGANPLTLVTVFDQSAIRSLHTLTIADLETPALPALARFEAEPHRVRLDWFAPGVHDARVERRTPATAWLDRGAPAEAPGGMLRFDDTDVIPGGHYTYQLRYGATPQFTEPVDVIVPPLAPSMSLAAANPGRALWVRLSLPEPTRARLAAFDIAGRCVADRWIDASEPGERVEALGDWLPQGVYLVKLLTRDRALQTRAVIVR